MPDRLLSPSAIVASWDPAQKLATVQPHAFTDPADYPTDASAWMEGDALEVWTADLSSRVGTANVVRVAPAGLLLDAAPAILAGHVLLGAPYASATVARRSASAFLADAVGLLPGGHPAHVYGS